MITGCSLVLVLIFFSIASLHFYWGVGGRWAVDSVVPTNERGERVLKTSPTSCFIVSAGLLLFTLYYLLMAGFMAAPIPTIILNLAGWIIPTIFLLRAIGDFRYVGFAKRIKDSTFARLDTAYFAPLCLLIAVLGLTIKVLG